MKSGTNQHISIPTMCWPWRAIFREKD